MQKPIKNIALKTKESYLHAIEFVSQRKVITMYHAWNSCKSILLMISWIIFYHNYQKFELIYSQNGNNKMHHDFYKYIIFKRRINTDIIFNKRPLFLRSFLFKKVKITMPAIVIIAPDFYDLFLWPEYLQY